MRYGLGLAVIAACKGGSDDEEVTAPPIVLQPNATATEASVDPGPEVTALVQLHQTLSAFVDLAVSSPTVISTFYIDGQLGIAPVPAYTPCFTAPSPGVAGFSYTLDLAGCTDESFEGVVEVENSAAGPITLTFSATTLDKLTLTGVLAFDYTTAGDGTWSVATADAFGTVVPLSVTGPDGSASVTMTGGFQLAPTGKSYDWWGQWSDGTVQIGVGGPPAVVAGSEVPGETQLFQTMPAACACAQSGDLVLPAGLRLPEVLVDLDDLQTDEDGVDDPEIAFAPAAGLSIAPTLPRGDACGTFGATVDAAVEITLTEAELAAGFSDACALGAIRDDGKCQRLQEASAGASVTVTLPAGVLEAALVDYTADAIDDEICQTDMASTGGPPGF